MPDAYVIEVKGTTVGIVARDGKSYRFYASLRSFYALEGERFATPRLAERAATTLLRRKRRLVDNDVVGGRVVVV
jgi:hypothetical protein